MQTLQALDAAARHGSYSAAAAELGLTHGAISHQIRELERRLNVTLFKREGRSMIATREAVTIIGQIRQALGVLHHAFPATQKVQGKLVIGVHPSLATCWLLPRIGDFLSTHPDLELEIRSTADIGNFLAPGIDVALRYGVGTWPNETSERIGDERLYPVASPSYRESRALNKPVDRAQCTLLRHAWQPWTPWLLAARLSLREPAVGLVLSDSAMLVEAAAAGLGVALVRERFALNAIRNGRLIRPFVLSVSDKNGYHLVWRQGEQLDEPAERFRHWLVSTMAEQSDGAGTG